MKNFLLLLFIVTTLSGCEDKKGQDCHVPPPVLSLLINRESEIYKEFVDPAGNLNKDNVKIYKEDKIYPFIFDNTYRKDYLIIRINLNFENDVYTGKTETLYLQNPVKTYKIEVNGYMQSKGCGPVAHTNEIRVDGVKIEDNYLAK
ncbi:hypothetical protein ACI76O_10370 [Capnocytophaga cynodegmi]|uniref:hypothetical protein n=1 Tax=Capnocytophaga cynodegmi TaxID=28189 RepID=UPI001AC5EB62|nr:hypothetical protein [Capnocytophaga cynodegmi]GIM53022.1 hypothetical protein CAPN004_20520 [Capnocytophaga cynodegmi]